METKALYWILGGDFKVTEVDCKDAPTATMGPADTFSRYIRLALTLTLMQVTKSATTATMWRKRMMSNKRDTNT